VLLYRLDPSGGDVGVEIAAVKADMATEFEERDAPFEDQPPDESRRRLQPFSCLCHRQEGDDSGRAGAGGDSMPWCQPPMTTTAVDNTHNG
jgi:hypothetical protein